VIISFTNYVLSNPLVVYGIGAAMAIICFGGALAVGSIVRAVARKER